MTLQLLVVDAFTDRPFAGNPAAVAVLGTEWAKQWPSESWMQAVALEMNLSETAFVRARADGDFDLRWFTPTAEVDLCGHATLATSHVVGDGRFHTRSGALQCARRSDGTIEMDFPSDPPHPVAPPDELVAVPAVRWYRGRFDLLAELPDAGGVRSFAPDLEAIASVDCRGLIVTAAGDRPGLDCVSRVFCPAVGVPEDPVTGSAHCTLACHWAERLGRTELVGYQASPRGGSVGMKLDGDRVLIAGNAVTVSEVRLLASPPPAL